MLIKQTFVRIALPIAVASLVSCTGVKNPQLAMCQALVKELSGSGVSKWDNISERDTERMRTVAIKYTSEIGAKGSISCNYPRRDEGKTTDTAPESVVLNGQRVDQKTLFASGTKVSKDMLTAAAELTALKTENLARDAANQAGELANEALNTAKDAAKSLQQ